MRLQRGNAGASLPPEGRRTVAVVTEELTLNNGVRMPVLGLGVFQSAPEQTAAAVETALQVRYRHIDTDTGSHVHVYTHPKTTYPHTG